MKYQDYLIESLKNPKEAIGYINAAYEEGDIEVFILALVNVLEALEIGMRQLHARTVADQFEELITSGSISEG